MHCRARLAAVNGAANRLSGCITKRDRHPVALPNRNGQRNSIPDFSDKMGIGMRQPITD
jgi:hypothetical protein